MKVVNAMEADGMQTPDIPHSWSNESEKPFRVLVVKVPRPVTSTKVL